jgi:hypothetical protein
MSKKKYRIYKAGGAQQGRIMNPTAQFLARAQEGIQQPSQDEMQMMQQQQQQQQLMQLVQDYSQIMQTSPEEVMQELQQSSPENQQILIEEMTQVVQQEQPAEQQQSMDRGGYVNMRIKELKEAEEGLEQEGSSVPTINDTPDGREAFVSEFTDAVKMSASDAARRKQAEEEFDSGNIPMARYGKNKKKRNTRQRNRRAVRKTDRESDMYSRPDRRLLRRGLREGDFTREEMLRGDNVLGKAGAPFMAPPGSTPMQSEEELLYTPEQVFDMLPYNTATPQEEVVQTSETVEETPGKNVIQPNGDPYEYKNEDGVLYTRMKGSDKWIKVDPESEAGISIRKNVYDEEGLSSPDSKVSPKSKKKVSKTTSLGTIPGLESVQDMINRNADEAFTFTGVPSADDGNASFEEIQALYASMGKQDPTQRGTSSPENLAKPSGRLDMLDKDWIMNTALAPAFATNLVPKWAPTGSTVPSVIGSGVKTALPKGQTVLNAGQKVLGQGQKLLGQGQKLIQAPGGAQFSLFEDGGEMDLPEARFGREQRMLNRFLRRQNRRNPVGYGMNQFGIPSSGLNMITPYGVAGSEGMQEKAQGSQGMFPGDFHMSTKYGIFGRPRRVDIDYTGNMPFNFMSPLMTGFFGQGFPTNTAYGGRYQSGIRYEDPITTVAKVVNKDQTTTDAEKQTEKRNQNDGKSKGKSERDVKSHSDIIRENEESLIGNTLAQKAFAESTGIPFRKIKGQLSGPYKRDKGSEPSLVFDPTDPSGFRSMLIKDMDYNVQMPIIEPSKIQVDPSRPINQSDLVVGQPAINPLLMPTGFGTAAAQGVTGLTKLLGSGSAAPKALGAGKRMLNPGQKLLEAPGGTQFTLFQPGGFVDPNDAGYGNPDLYKFISGGMDEADIDYMNSKDVTDSYMMNEGGVNPITGTGTTVGDINNVTNRYTYNPDGTRGAGIADNSAEVYLSKLNNPIIGPSGSVTVDGNVVAKGFQDYYKRPIAQDGLEVYQDKGEVNETAIGREYEIARSTRDGGRSLNEFNKKYPNYKADSQIGLQKDTFDPRYSSPVNQRFNNNYGYNMNQGFVSESMDPRYGGRFMYPSNPNWQPTPGIAPDPRMQYRPQQGFPMPGVGYPGGYGRQQYPMQRANPMGMLAGSAFGNTYGFRGAGQPKIFNRAGSYWTQTGFPGQPVNMNNLTSAKFKGRQGLFGPRGKAEFTFGASGDGKQSTDPLITLDKNKGSMIEGPGKQDEGSGYMTNRQFARDQFDKNPNMLRADKRALRRGLNRGDMTQLEYLDDQADAKSKMYQPDAGKSMPSGQLDTRSPGMPQIQQNGNPYVQSPGMESMPLRPADQIQTGGYDAPTGPAAGSAQAISGTPEITPTYSFGQPQTFGSASGYGTPSVSSGSTSSDPYADGVYDYGERNNPNSDLVKKYKDFGATYTNEDGVGSAIYEEGGEYDLTEAEIGLIMQAGGMVEYI